MTRHAIARPLCVVCHARPRTDNGVRCADCGPGRVMSAVPPSVAKRPPRRPPDPVTRAAAVLGDDTEAADQ